MIRTRIRIPLKSATVIAVLAGTAASPAGAVTGDFTQVLCANPDTATGVYGDGFELENLSAPASVASWVPSLTAPCGAANSPGYKGINITPTTTGSAPSGAYAALRYSLSNTHVVLKSGTIYRAIDGGPNASQMQFGQHAGADTSNPQSDPFNQQDYFESQVSPSGRGIAADPFAAANRLTLVTTPTGFSIAVRCGASLGNTCPTTPGSWFYRLFGGRLLLHDDIAPVVTSVRGDYLDTEPLTGSVDFYATDQGSGAYRYGFLVDGVQVAAQGFPDPDTQSCRDVNVNNDDPYEFPRATPCPAAIAGDARQFDTSAIPDGMHHLQGFVEDAGGNRTIFMDRQALFDSTPEPRLINGTTVALTGTPKVGQRLIAQDGTWGPKGTTFIRFWQRCNINGENCTQIDGERGALHELTDADLGKRIQYGLSAYNGFGNVERVLLSETITPADVDPAAATPGPTTPTPSSPDPNPLTPAAPGSDPLTGTRAPTAGPTTANGKIDGRGAHVTAALANRRGHATVTFTARPSVSGRLTSASGTPIAGAQLELVTQSATPSEFPSDAQTTTTDAEGNYRVALRTGPSRSVVVRYFATQSDRKPETTARVTLTVRATLSFRVGAARVRRTTTMSGHLAHLGRAGIQIQIQALDGRRWRTFDTVKTKAGGRFTYGYRFKPSAAGRYFYLRALVDTPGYPFAKGVSRAVRVTVRG